MHMFFYTTLESITDGYKFEWLTILSIFAIAFAIFTIVTKSPIYSILYLIGLFLAISLYLIESKLHFIGISYILVYVGAIAILFLFILMLINVRISELLTEGKNSAILSILVVIAFSIVFNSKLPSSINIYQQLYSTENYIEAQNILTNNNSIDAINFYGLKNNDISLLSSYSWDNSLIEISHISAIGNILYNLQYVSLIIIGIILLLAIVGCIIVTVKSKDNIDHVNDDLILPDYVKMTTMESSKLNN